ncbi:DMT family transporter [Phenylobacterium sp.]|uniref:EamA family transporter n=1 Tax=Phenylobacterium sp. TaxID=1871053 RepID=UPI0027325F66|nr:EamA family transporter [Phenylobacterium sp.]MDP3658826.1 EamA family transporter [Phenylobacterium sp.]
MTQVSKPASLFLPMAAAVGAMATFQIGAAFSKWLFPLVGPQGAAALRLALASVILLAVVRPWRVWPKDAPVRAMLLLGASMAGAVLMFFLALDRLPLGVIIALQFLGPLAIALFGSRKFHDLVWAALAAAGVWLLVGAGPAGKDFDMIGLGFALAGGGFWAAYILLGGKVSAAFGSSTAAVAVTIAAVIVLPVGIIQAGGAMFAPSVIPLAVLVALFTTVIPFSLEFYALPRMPARTFSVFTSLEPAFAVLSGLILLGEHLAWSQITGVALVIAAAAGATWSTTATPPVAPTN